MSLSKPSNCAVQLIPESEVNQNNKSIYCDYNEAFIGYDEIRQPHGLQCILNIFQQSEVPLEKQIVLEGGFGTGAYLDKIRHHVKKIYGVEGSDEGYQQTKKKVNNAANVNLRIGNILGLPFPGKLFHSYLVNQVLHHLDHSNHFQQLDVFLAESIRVLKPGGNLVINTCSQDQLDPETGSYWHYKYFPAAAEAIRKRYLPIKELEARLASLGFTEIKRTIPTKKIFRKDYYKDPYIALQPEFRLGDSAYSFLSAAELDVSNKGLMEAIDDGSVRREMHLFAERAGQIGETVIISAHRMS
jgi:ubiquinone/menaquinone biosynthesis C-methylase UbiE